MLFFCNLFLTVSRCLLQLYVAISLFLAVTLVLKSVRIRIVKPLERIINELFICSKLLLLLGHQRRYKINVYLS